MVARSRFSRLRRDGYGSRRFWLAPFRKVMINVLRDVPVSVEISQRLGTRARSTAAGNLVTNQTTLSATTLAAVVQVVASCEIYTPATSILVFFPFRLGFRQRRVAAKEPMTHYLIPWSA
ncbi:hypothetical protein LZ32DRAFT_309772 [Colletotrichum eremochloae]|nr:hypothetical protein LZ32DRAFT_309772 [Colletotrichum eremochloae]